MGTALGQVSCGLGKLERMPDFHPLSEMEIEYRRHDAIQRARANPLPPDEERDWRTAQQYEADLQRQHTNQHRAKKRAEQAAKAGNGPGSARVAGIKEQRLMDRLVVLEGKLTDMRVELAELRAVRKQLEERIKGMCRKCKAKPVIVPVTEAPVEEGATRTVDGQKQFYHRGKWRVW